MAARRGGRTRVPWPARGAGRGLLALASVLVALSSLHAAARGDAGRGRALADSLCGRCHATGASEPSPLADAPPFRTLKRRYPVESLAEPLAEGLVTGHPAMPEIQLEPAAIADFLAYLESL